MVHRALTTGCFYNSKRIWWLNKMLKLGLSEKLLTLLDLKTRTFQRKWECKTRC
jgi:hypothetical protein